MGCFDREELLEEFLEQAEKVQANQYLLADNVLSVDTRGYSVTVGGQRKCTLFDNT